MKVKIKKLHPDAVIPAYAKTGDAGMDLTAVSMKTDEYGNICYGTGLAFEIPEGYVGLVFPRSSIYKSNLNLSNSVGVIDSGYRGEVSFKFNIIHNVSSWLKFKWQKLFKKDPMNVPVMTLGFNKYKVGDRIGQIIIMPYPQIEFEEVEQLSQTERGTQGYGSSGE